MPITSISANPNPTTTGQTVNFSAIVGGSIVLSQWDFGDGSPIANGLNVTHIFNSANTYLVTFTLKEKNGKVSKKTINLTVNQVIPPPPTVNIGPDVTTNVGTSVIFNGIITNGQAPFIYDWNFGDGTTHSTNVSPSHQFSNSGQYTVTLTVTDAFNRTASDSLITTVGQPQNPNLLSPQDFTFLGYYVLKGWSTNLGGITFRTGLAHRYVNGDLRFLLVAYNDGANDLIEVALPSGGFGQNIFDRTNFWPGNTVWPNGGILPTWQGLWYEDKGGIDDRLWSADAIDYPDIDTDGMTQAISVRHLNNDGTISALNGRWGFQNISQRCIYGKVQLIPTWFQNQYGVGPYLYGFGGYASKMSEGGAVSLGLFALAGPDVTNYTPAPNYNNINDWSIPTGSFDILADHRSGTIGDDWYNQYTGQNFIPPFDRGWRLPTVQNYYEGGQAYIGGGTATFTNGSNIITFSDPQTLNDSDWIGPWNGNALVGQSGNVISGAINNALSATLNGPYTGQTTTYQFLVDVRPPQPPQGSWQSPAPDGNGRWVWGDSYTGTTCWIDTPNKTGIVCIGAFSRGKTWYHAPGNYLGSDSGSAEIHIFDPNDLGKVKLGQKNPWNVQPISIKDITNDLLQLNICSASRNMAGNNVAGATFDSTTKRLWLFCPGINANYDHAGYDCILACYQVNC